MNTHLTPSFKTFIMVQEEPEQTQSKRTEIVPTVPRTEIATLRYFYGTNITNYLYQIRIF